MVKQIQRIVHIGLHVHKDDHDEKLLVMFLLEMLQFLRNEYNNQV